VANYLKMLKRQQVLALLELGWSYRRIQDETGVRRETVSRYDRIRRAKAAKAFAGSDDLAGGPDPPDPAPGGTCSEGDPAKAAKPFPGSAANPAKVFPGSERPSRSAAAAFHDVIVGKHAARLSVQRIWQDLTEDYGYGHSYESVKRYVRRLCRDRKIVGVFPTTPGEEAQVDFFRGAPTLEAETGQWKRPWVFRMTLCHSRHGYEEAVWDQTLETFLRLHENAFRAFGGVPRVIRHDNLKAAVVRACLHDPDVHETYAAFARHWGFTPLPTRPRNPQENGKQERSGGYVKSNALQGRRFDSLEEQNQHLRHWNRTVARLRIHGTTRKQVWTHFLETERDALQPLPREPFVLFQSGERTVHPDGHVEVQGAFYPAPVHLLGRKLRVRWDGKMVRLYHDDTQIAVYARRPPGAYAPAPGAAPADAPAAQRAFVERLLGRCERVGDDLRRWAEEALEERGVRALRLIQGVVGLTRSHPKERVLQAARTATEHRLFRYKDLRRLADAAGDQTPPRSLIDEHPSIRPLIQYRLEDLP
jgi:transposase